MFYLKNFTVYAINLSKTFFIYPKMKKSVIYRQTWNVRSLCRADSVVTVSKELLKHKLDLVGVQIVR
jgi:hypothetical protein